MFVLSRVNLGIDIDVQDGGDISPPSPAFAGAGSSLPPSRGKGINSGETFRCYCLFDLGDVLNLGANLWDGLARTWRGT